jgi:hypothetical protein
MRKVNIIQTSHDFILKTKFNREEILKIKSIFDSIMTLSIKSDKKSIDRGVEKELVIEAIGGFGFDTSPNLLR